MSSKTINALTREWIMLMIFESPKTRGELIDHGCKVMVFGHEYDDFVKIIDAMDAENYLFRGITSGKHELTEKGKFYVKKHITIPLQGLTENPQRLQEFMVKYRDQCDTNFLRDLSYKKTDYDRLEMIKKFAEQNYDKIAKIIMYANEFLS